MHAKSSAGKRQLTYVSLVFKETIPNVFSEHTTLVFCTSKLAFALTPSLISKLNMDAVGKIEIEVQIESAANNFHQVLWRRPHHLANVSPNIKKVELLEGDWGTLDSVINCHYVIGKQSFPIIFWE